MIEFYFWAVEPCFNLITFNENFAWNSTETGDIFIIRAREKFYIQNPESRIDELLFQKATTKISAPNSKYNCSFAQ
jgi:hypothetical protein